MRKVFRYISYAIIYLIISLASAYGVITISVNNSNNQSKGNINSKPNPTPNAPTQLTSMIENIMNCGFLSLDLSADLSFDSEKAVINVNSQIDLTNGLENAALDGNISVELENLNQNFVSGFAYQKGIAYFDLLNGKISVDTSNIIGSIQQIISLTNIELPSLGIEEVLAELDLNTILGFLSNLEEIPAEDGTDNVTLKITIPMIEKDLYLYCNKDYKLNGIKFDYISDEISASINATIGYPNELNIIERNPEDYIETCNLLEIVSGALNYIKSNNAYAFNLNASYSNLAVNGTVYVNTTNSSAKLSTAIGETNLNIIALDKTLYIEYAGVYLKFNLQDVDKLSEFIENSFGVKLPLDKITSLLNNIKNGDYSDILDNVNTGSLENFDINDIDLSIIEKVYVNGDTTFINIKDVGSIGFAMSDKSLKSISFKGLDVSAKLEVASFQDFKLNTNEENYIDIIDVLPTLENALDILNKNTINGSINIEYNGIQIPVEVVVSSKDNYFKASLTLDGKEISIQKLNNKIYVEVAGIANIVVDLDTITDSLIDFLSNIKYDIDLTKYAGIFDKLKDVLNPAVTPLLIKSFEKTPNGIVVTLFNDITFSIENDNNTITVSTNVEGLKIGATITGDESKVTIPTFNDDDYNTVESLLDLAEAVINSGLLEVVEGSYNTFKSGKVALDLNVTYSGQNIVGTVYADVTALKAYITLNYNNESVNIILENEVVYIEYNNIFVKFNLSDAPAVIAEIAEKLNIDIPFDLINSILDAVNNGDIEGVVDIITGEIGNDFKLDISKIDVDFFRNIVVDGNNTIVNIDDNTIIFTVVDKYLTAIEFKSFGAGVKANVISYVDKTTVTSKDNYINVADLFPTIENVINIVKADTLSGKINLSYKDLNLKLNYLISKKDNIYANINTTIKDMLISIDYLDGKVYFNAADKLMLVAAAKNLPTAISEFLTKIGVEMNSNSSEFIDTILELLDPTINPQLITSFVKRENGFEITILNKVTLTIENGSNELALSTTINDITANITLLGDNSIVTIPTFNDEDYNTVESLLDLAEAVINSGLLEVVEGLYNTFKSGKVALDLNVTYSGQNIVGTVYADVTALKAYITLNYQNQSVNIILENEVVYIEYNNIFVKFNLSDAPAVITEVSEKLNLDIPFDLITSILDAVNNGDIEGVVDIITGEIGSDFKLDISKIDVDFFRNIVVDGNNTIVNIDDNKITFTVVEKYLTAIAFKGFGAEVKANVVEYKDKTTVTSKDNYINVADFFPTIKNIVNIVKADTLSGKINLSCKDLNLELNYLVSKKDTVYANVNTTIKDMLISIDYLDGKVYFNAADKLMLVATIENLPTAISEFLTKLGVEMNSNSEEFIDTILELLDPTINPQLITSFVKSENGIEITILDKVTLTIENGSNELVLSTTINDISANITLIGDNSVVSIPVFDDSQYNTVESLLDLAEAVINSGLLEVMEGSYNTFKSGKVALDLNVTYSGQNIVGSVYADVTALKAYITLNYQNQSVNIILENEVVYIEYNNIFVKFNLSDAPAVITEVSEKLNLNIPFDLINSILDAVNNGDIEGVVDIITGEIGTDFKLDISKIDVDFFRNIIVDGNNTIVNIDDNTITFTVVEKYLTAIAFNGFGADVKANIVEYKDKTTATSKDNYINIADFFPTIENAINIVKADTLSGKINLSYKDLNLELNYLVSKKDNIYANINTTIKDMLISINYLDGKVYFNAADKLMLVATVKNLPTAISEFLSKIGVEMNSNSGEFIDTILELLDPTINPQLITSFVKSENGFEITILDKVTLTIENGSNELSLSTTINGISANITLLGDNSIVSIPVFDDSQYNTVESLLDLAEAVINSGLLEVVEGGYNAFKSGKVALDLNVTYSGQNIIGSVYADVTALKAYITLNYQNESVNIILENEVVYIEYNNIFVKFNLSDAPAVITEVSEKLNLDIPFDLINSILDAVNNGDIEGVVDIITGEIGNDFKLDISKIDVDFFRNIVVDGNNTIVNIDDNTITFTVVDKYLTAIAFKGFDADVKANIVEYKDKTTITSKDNYINVADLFPTIENAINIVKSSTITAQLNITAGTMEIPVILTVAKAENLYIKVDAVLFKTHLYIYHYDNKVLVQYGDIKIRTDLEALPEQLKELTDGIDTLINPILDLLGIDLGNIGSSDKDNILDPSINPLLIKHLTQTETGFTLRLYNDMDVTIGNDTNKIDISLTNKSLTISGYICGSEENVERDVVDESTFAELNDTFRLINAAKNMSKQKDFHIAGTVNLKVLSINIGNIPLDIQIKVDENLNLQLAMELSLPDNLNLGSLVGFDMVNTHAYDRKIKIYYLDGFVHLYRTENAGSLIGKKTQHEVYAKVSPSDLFADILNYVQFTFDFTDKMIELMTAATDHGRDSTDNPNFEFYFERALKGFTVTNENNGAQTKYDLTINLAELADNPQLGNFKLSLYVGENENGESYLQKLPIDLTVASVVNIVSTDGNAISIVDYGKPVDEKVAQIKEFVNEFDKFGFDYEAQMERNGGSGDWTKLSEKLYTLTFINGNETISTITGPRLQEITLPVLTDYDTTENGVKVRKTFAGWFTDDDIEFNSTVMPKGSKTLYAKWNSENYITLTFTTGTTEKLSIVELAGSPISLPTPTIPKQTVAEDGKTVTTYKFAGWYLDEMLTQEFNSSVMPSENTTIYSSWTLDKVEVRAEFKLYNKDNLIYSIYLPENEVIDLSEVALVNETTKFYLDPAFENEFTDSLVMPKDSLTLYIRNKFTLTMKSEYGNIVNETVEYWQGENIYIPSQITHYQDDEQGTTRNYYYFDGYEINGITTEIPTTMPDENLVVIAQWTNEVYYKVSFDLRWYIVDGCAIGSKFINEPPAIEAEWILAGSTLDLSQDKYKVSGYAKKSAFNNKGTYTSTSWGTSAWGNYTKGGKGFTSIVIDKPYVLYACWQEQQG